MARYFEELAQLQQAYSATIAGLSDALLADLRTAVARRDVYFVGSGGTLPVAELAASLHQRYTGMLARATTPLRFMETSRFAREATVVLFSARARHPDTGIAAAHARAYGHRVVLVTQRLKEDLTGDLGDESLSVLTLPRLPQGDGFLATSSVLAMATTIAAAYARETLNDHLEIAPPLTQLRERLLVLHGEAGRAAAHDIEVRVSELGLADAQLADYRNFAHGRHVGLQRRLDSTSVIALISPADSALAERTLASLPEIADVREIRAGSDTPAGALELLASAMSLPLAFAKVAGVEPSRPKVPAFGRALYHLPYKRMYSPVPRNPIDRKLGEPFGVPKALFELYRTAYTDWIATVNETPLNGFVLDYDGTLVRTPDRFELPTAEVRTALINVLELGVPIAFATGRGASLYKGLREWIPQRLWGRVLLGLHTGAWFQELAADLETPPEFESKTLAALRVLVESGTADVVPTGRQVSVRPKVAIGRDRLRDLVTSLTANVVAVRVESSAHSVDVTEAGAQKKSVLEYFERRHGPAFAIGDQGDIGGNDFSLLAATALSISVDECSSDPTRCWNITDSSITGPEALAVALRAAVVRRGRFALRLKPVLDHR